MVKYPSLPHPADTAHPRPHPRRNTSESTYSRQLRLASDMIEFPVLGGLPLALDLIGEARYDQRSNARQLHSP